MSRLPRKNAQPLGEAIQEWLKSSRLSAGMNTRLVSSAWDKASGAAEWTVRRYYRDGVLHITLSSSTVRSQLWFQKDALMEKMNAILSGDPLFACDEPHTGYIKELILK